MLATSSLPLHHRLRQATKACHHALDHHPLLSSLLGSTPSLVQYGDALSALHGIYAQSEAAIFFYLRQHPALFDYRSRRKLSAMEADLAALGRTPMPMQRACPAVDSCGALFGTLYTLEGSTLGGQFIANHLRRATATTFPLRFYTVYGDQARQRWDQFLHCAEALCPQSEYQTAATTAAGLFETIKQHLDDCQHRLAGSEPLQVRPVA